MKKHHLWAICGALVGWVVIAAWAGEHGEKREHEPQQITMAQLPARAREELIKLAGPNKLLGLVVQHDQGSVTYQGVWRVQGRAHSAFVTVDGALAATQETVEGQEVPPAVRTAAEKLLPGAQKLTFEKSTKVSYDVFGTIDGTKKKIEVTPAGTTPEKRGWEGGKERD